MKHRRDRANIGSESSVEERDWVSDGQNRIKNCQKTLDAALIRAVYHQNIEGTYEALTQGANPDAEADEGMHAIHFAALYGNPNLLHLLIRFKADTNRLCGGSGLSALHCATLMGHATSVRLLLEKGKADPNVVSSLTARTPLQISVSVVRPESVQIGQTLIEHGANIDVMEDKDMTLLHICGNDEAIVKMLVDAGVNLMAESKKELTSLHSACRNGHLRKVKALVKAGAKVNNNTMNCLKSPLHFACDGGHLEIVRFLVKDAGADVLCQDRSGKLALHQACKNKQKAIVDFFVDECGFSPCIQDGKGNTCVHWACKKADISMDETVDKIIEFVESLLDRIPGLAHIPNYDDQIPLHHAAAWNPDLCQVLVEKYKSDVTKKDLVGQTPLIFAARQGVVSTVSYFAKNSYVNKDDRDYQGWAALHWAVFRYNERMIRTLLWNEANANIKSICGRTPLHLISRFIIPTSFHDRDSLLDGLLDRSIIFQRRPDTVNHCVQALLEHGSDCMAMDRHCNLSFFLAAATGSVNDTYLIFREAIGQGLFGKAVNIPVIAP